MRSGSLSIAVDDMNNFGFYASVSSYVGYPSGSFGISFGIDRIINSDMKKNAFIKLYLLIPLLCFLFKCTDYEKRQCEKFTGFYNDVQFNVVILSNPVAEPNYYRLSVRDLASKRDSILFIDRELVALSPIWNVGDTLTKNQGNTIVELRKRYSILNTKKFLIAWTCKGTFINGEAGEIWKTRLASLGLK